MKYQGRHKKDFIVYSYIKYLTDQRFYFNIRFQTCVRENLNNQINYRTSNLRSVDLYELVTECPMSGTCQMSRDPPDFKKVSTATVLS